MTSRNAAQFNLKKPCQNCPFIDSSKSIELMPGRRHQIIMDLVKGISSAFPCHKTVFRDDRRNHNDEGEYTSTVICQCPGAIAVAQKCGQTPTIVQVAERLGVIKPGHYDVAHETSIWPEDIAVDGGVDLDTVLNPFR